MFSHTATLLVLPFHCSLTEAFELVHVLQSALWLGRRRGGNSSCMKLCSLRNQDQKLQRQKHSDNYAPGNQKKNVNCKERHEPQWVGLTPTNPAHFTKLLNSLSSALHVIYAQFKMPKHVKMYFEWEQKGRPNFHCMREKNGRRLQGVHFFVFQSSASKENGKILLCSGAAL